jgi:DNA-binding GntR family transcriptional regulator
MITAAPARGDKTPRRPGERQSSPSTPKLREQAYQSFTERLLARDIRPGQFVSQRELVGITGMSLGAIRELIPRLEADGLIKTVPQRGMQIAHVDLNLIRNAFQFRLILEKEAVTQFVETASDDELQALRQVHQATLTEAGRGVTPDLLRRAQQMDWDLHDLMIDRLGNDIISSAYRVNSIKIRLIIFERVRMLPELVVSVMNEHLPIITALQRRDAAAAVVAIEAHIGSARARALQI